jgi:predicted NUDIX family phosphoesterase
MEEYDMEEKEFGIMETLPYYWDGFVRNLEGVSQEEIVNEIYKKVFDFPRTSMLHIKGMELLNHLSKHSQKVYILCTPAWGPDNYHINNNFKHGHGIIKESGIFSEFLTFCENEEYIFLTRKEAEYNLRYKQICTAAYIKDMYDNFILLETTDRGRIKSKLTLIQGHVDFTKEAYITNQYDYLRNNMRKELCEEICNGEMFDVPARHKYLISTNKDFVCLEHMGPVYEILVDDCTKIIDQIQTAEPTKHIVRLVTGKELENSNLVLDDWLRLVLEKEKVV